MMMPLLALGAGSSLGGGGAIVLGLSGWLGRVWAERLMEKERHENARALESDRAKYGKELEELKAKYEETHRRLQEELDETIFGHQLKTQTEFNALQELWKEVPSLEATMGNIAGLFLFKDEWLFKGAGDSYLGDLVRQIEKLTTLIGSFGPFVDPRIYEDIQELLGIAMGYHRIVVHKMESRPAAGALQQVSLDAAYPRAFAEVRQRLFKSVSDRITELSQYDRPTEPADK